MASIIKGGLIYEFTEEPNNYGLVKVLPDQNIQLLEDFHRARTQLNSIPSKINYQEASFVHIEPPRCEGSYKNLFTTRNLPPCVAQDLVNQGIRVQPGGYVELTKDLLQSPYKVFDVDGSLVYSQQTHIEIVLPFFLWPKKVSGTYDFALDSALEMSKSFSNDLKSPKASTDSSGDTLRENVFHLWAWSDDEYDQEEEAEEKETVLRKLTKTINATRNLFRAMISKALGDDKISDKSNAIL